MGKIKSFLIKESFIVRDSDLRPTAEALQAKCIEEFAEDGVAGARISLHHVIFFLKTSVVSACVQTQP